MSDLQTLVAQEVKRQVASLLTADSTVKKVLNYLKSSGGGHSLGDTWISIDGSIPAGGVPFCGQLVTRAMYADLFAWAQEQGKVKTESEWQAHASANGGNCPYYSAGDGSTNFRMPAVVAYLKGATSASNAGQYEAQKLPNLYGQIAGGCVEEGGTASGVFEISGTYSGAQAGHSDSGIVFDASKYDSTYQSGADVTPETFTVLVGVYAGSYSNTGDIDIAGLQTSMAALETEVNAKPSPNAYVVQTWRSGAEWYRVWSNGFIEQGGYMNTPRNTNSAVEVSFHKSFSSADTVNVLATGRSANAESDTASQIHSVTATSFSVYDWNNRTTYWLACGY